MKNKSLLKTSYQILRKFVQWGDTTPSSISTSFVTFIFPLNIFQSFPFAIMWPLSYVIAYTFLNHKHIQLPIIHMNQHRHHVNYWTVHFQKTLFDWSQISSNNELTNKSSFVVLIHRGKRSKIISWNLQQIIQEDIVKQSNNDRVNFGILEMATFHP